MIPKQANNILNNITITPRCDSAENWANSKRILAYGEFGLDVDNEILKMGNGIDLWVDLPDRDIKDYAKIKNKPQINGVELKGNKSLEDIGIETMTNEEIEDMFKLVFGE